MINTLRALMKKSRQHARTYKQCQYRDKNSKRESIVKETKNVFDASLDWTQPRR